MLINYFQIHMLRTSQHYSMRFWFLLTEQLNFLYNTAIVAELYTSNLFVKAAFKFCVQLRNSIQTCCPCSDELEINTKSKILSMLHTGLNDILYHSKYIRLRFCYWNKCVRKVLSDILNATQKRFTYYYYYYKQLTNVAWIVYYISLCN